MRCEATGDVADWLSAFDPTAMVVAPGAAVRGDRPAATLSTADRYRGTPAASTGPEHILDSTFLGRPSNVRYGAERTTICTPSRGLRIVLDAHAAAVDGDNARQVGLTAGVLAAAWTIQRARAAGWHLVHASAFRLDGVGVLCLGAKASGKSTVAMTAAHRLGAALLCNDHCLVHAGGDAVIARAVPQPAALGFGLITALGWGPALSAAIGADGLHHPSLRGPRRAFALSGRTTALRDDSGAEVKIPVLSAELSAVFGVHCIDEMRIDAVLRPHLGARTATPLHAPHATLTQLDLLPDDVGEHAHRWLRPHRAPGPQALPLAVPATELSLPRSVDGVAQTVLQIVGAAA